MTAKSKRRRPGRPPTAAAEATAQFPARLTPSALADLDRYALHHGLSRSEALRQAVDGFLKYEGWSVEDLERDDRTMQAGEPPRRPSRRRPSRR